MFKGTVGREIDRNFGEDFKFVSSFKGFEDRCLLYLAALET